MPSLTDWPILHLWTNSLAGARFLMRSRLWRYNFDAFKHLQMCSAAKLHKMRNCTYVQSMIQVRKEDEFFRDIKLNIFYKTFFIICNNYWSIKISYYFLLFRKIKKCPLKSSLCRYITIWNSVPPFTDRNTLSGGGVVRLSGDPYLDISAPGSIQVCKTKVLRFGVY